MEILVFSDSHGRLDRMREVVQRVWAVRPSDAIIFLGDGLRDAERLESELPKIPFYKVRGNCDAFFAFDNVESPTERLIELGGKRIFITHGHMLSAKCGCGRLITEAERLGADIVMFGHTHEPISEYIMRDGSENPDGKKSKGIYLFNPGSIGYGGTWGIVTLTACGEIFASHGSL